MRRLFRLVSVAAFAAMLAPAAARAATTSCNIPQPCAVFANNNGVALEGESAGADGVLGEASSGTIYGAGIEGESLKQTGADAAGTFGLTLLSNGVAPNYGVVAYGSLYGVYGQAGNTGLSQTGPGYGVFGQDNAGSSSKDYNAGVTGLSKNNVGVLAEGSGAPTLGYYGVGDPIGLYAVGDGTNGNMFSVAYGIVAESNYLGAVIYNTNIKNQVEIAGTSYSLVDGKGDFSVDYSGNEFLAGKLTVVGGTTDVHGGPYLRTTGASGRTVTAYSEHTTSPEMADVGEAQLVNGRAFVPIDASFADVIDVRGGYHVFITPEGENKGLYVVKGPGGFLVREQQGGRSTLAFDYRIVANPREEHGARLARVTDVAPRVDPPAGVAHVRSQLIPLPLSPEERLKREIGPHAYADLMTSLGRRFASLHAR